MRLKRLGCSVVLLHHTNKARDDGFQIESGSAHQLTNIETQIFVQPCVYDELQARRMGGVWIEDEKNYVRSLEPGGDSMMERAAATGVGPSGTDAAGPGFGLGPRAETAGRGSG